MAIKEAAKQGRTDVDGVWIGGTQTIESRNHTLQLETNVAWEWADDSIWFDNDGAYWADGQPNNALHLTDSGSTKGKHFIVLDQEGKYRDQLGCARLNATKHLPSILILPSDYSDRTKYRNCRSSTFTAHIPVPQRT